MDGDVPGLPESSDVLSVPPVAVELAVGEAEQLCREVHHRVEHPVETKQPEQVVRQLWVALVQCVCVRERECVCVWVNASRGVAKILKRWGKEEKNCVQKKFFFGPEAMPTN